MADFSTLDDLYGSDEERSTKGVDVHIGLNRKNDPIIIVVAEAGNAKHSQAMRKYERALESCRHNRKKRRLINAKIIAESLLLDWKGILDAKGKPVEANFDNKVDAMMHSSQFMGDVVDAASDRANFVADQNDNSDETEKNSPAS